MMRPSEKLLKDMSIEELATESRWHSERAEALFEKVGALREQALDVDETAAETILQDAAQTESEAEAHLHQSNLIDMIHASRLSDKGVGVVVRSATQ